MIKINKEEILKKLVSLQEKNEKIKLKKEQLNTDENKLKDEKNKFNEDYEKVISGKTDNPFTIMEKEDIEKKLKEREEKLSKDSEDIEEEENRYKDDFRKLSGDIMKKVDSEKEEIKAEVKELKNGLSEEQKAELTKEKEKLKAEKEKIIKEKERHIATISKWEKNGINTNDAIYSNLKDKIIPDKDKEIDTIDKQIEEINKKFTYNPSEKNADYSELEKISNILKNTDPIESKINDLKNLFEVKVEEKSEQKQEQKAEQKPETEKETKAEQEEVDIYDELIKNISEMETNIEKEKKNIDKMIEDSEQEQKAEQKADTEKETKAESKSESKVNPNTKTGTNPKQKQQDTSKDIVWAEAGQSSNSAEQKAKAEQKAETKVEQKADTKVELKQQEKGEDVVWAGKGKASNQNAKHLTDLKFIKVNPLAEKVFYEKPNSKGENIFTGVNFTSDYSKDSINDTVKELKEDYKNILNNDTSSIDAIASAIDPNIVDFLNKNFDDKDERKVCIKQYLNALHGEKIYNEFPKIIYNLRDIYKSNLDYQQIKNVIKIAKSAKKLNKNLIKIEQDNIIKRSISNLKRIISDSKTKKIEAQSKDDNARTENKKGIKLRGKEFFEKAMQRAQEKGSKAHFKSEKLQRGREYLKIIGTTIKGLFTGKDLSDTVDKINSFKDRIVVQEGTVDEKKALENAENKAKGREEQEKEEEQI